MAKKTYSYSELAKKYEDLYCKMSPETQQCAMQIELDSLEEVNFRQIKRYVEMGRALYDWQSACYFDEVLEDHIRWAEILFDGDGTPQLDICGLGKIYGTENITKLYKLLSRFCENRVFL